MAAKQKIARIVGVGSYVPEQVLTNADLEKMVDTSGEWIVQRTGIEERRIAGGAEASSDMGIAAAIKALEVSGKSASEIDLIIVATMTPDVISSATASLIQEKLKASRAGAVDIQAACTGFIYGLSMAKAFIESGMYQNVLLVASEKMSSVTDYTDRSTCILFGDGASAVVISDEGKGLAVGNVSLGSDGSCADLITIPAGGSRDPITKENIDKGMHFVKLEGREVFKHAVRRMAGVCSECLRLSNIELEDVAWLVAHQANMRIIDALARKLDFPEEKIIKTVSKYGNTSASSVPLALDELLENKEVNPGQTILLTAFGAGLSWGAATLKVMNEEN
ncbi:MAG: beta-ketoacyl-ACP synthase III [Chlamydiota bacterium]|nr:beta-ketoacyl-ACP synthase III [Chlamydiota bacterium]